MALSRRPDTVTSYNLKNGYIGNQATVVSVMSSNFAYRYYDDIEFKLVCITARRIPKHMCDETCVPGSPCKERYQLPRSPKSSIK